MRKIVSFLLALCLLSVLIAVSAGGQQAVSAAEGEGSSALRIVTTIFPAYDWVRQILGEDPSGAEVSLLIDNGVDLHSYQPSIEDIREISDCDLFIYVGGTSDAWVQEALKQSDRDDRMVISLLDVLGDAVREEEIVEGMEAEDHEEAKADAEAEGESDEHVWLSLRNASLIVDQITEALQQLDPEHADVYQDHAASYQHKLADLDERYREAVAGANGTTILFGDRFPFRYLTEDYGLDYYAAFAGCSAETEASFETIVFLSQKIDELALPAILVLEGSDPRIAETVVQTTRDKDQKILTLDSMQSVTAEDVEQGVTYLSVMEDNLSVLKEALS